MIDQQPNIAGAFSGLIVLGIAVALACIIVVSLMRLWN